MNLYVKKRRFTADSGVIMNSEKANFSHTPEAENLGMKKCKNEADSGMFINSEKANFSHAPEAENLGMKKCQNAADSGTRKIAEACRGFAQEKGPHAAGLARGGNAYRSFKQRGQVTCSQSLSVRTLRRRILL